MLIVVDSSCFVKKGPPVNGRRLRVESGFLLLYSVSFRGLCVRVSVCCVYGSIREGEKGRGEESFVYRHVPMKEFGTLIDYLGRQVGRHITNR